MKHGDDVLEVIGRLKGGVKYLVAPESMFEHLGIKYFGPVDGHDIEAVIDVLNDAKASRNGKPHAVIAHTIKGKGVSYMENQASWHGKAPNADELAQALEELA